MEDEFNLFVHALGRASACVEDLYFNVPIAGRDRPATRERAYCYELYRWLREELPPDFPFTLHGEIDKRGHPRFAECVRNANPDFVVHRPGYEGAGANLAVVEVKPFSSSRRRLAADFDSLGRFVAYIEYYRAVQLIFGGREDLVRDRVRQAYDGTPDREYLEVFWHPAPGTEAQRLTW